MAEYTTISIDKDTLQVVERISERTGLKKSEIARQAFSAYLEALTFGKAEIIAVTPTTPTPTPDNLTQQ